MPLKDRIIISFLIADIFVQITKWRHRILRTKLNKEIFKMGVTAPIHQELQKMTLKDKWIGSFKCHSKIDSIALPRWVAWIEIQYQQNNNNHGMTYRLWLLKPPFGNKWANRNQIVHKIRGERERLCKEKESWLERTCQSNNDERNKINLLTSIVRVSVYRARSIFHFTNTACILEHET